MQILGLLGMYFDAVVVFVTKFSLLFRLALATICCARSWLDISGAECYKIHAKNTDKMYAYCLCHKQSCRG